MRDKLSEQRAQELHPNAKHNFITFIEDAEESLNITLRIIQGYRSFEEQDELYSHGRTKFVDEHGNKLGIVTNAKAGQSYHQYRLAIDVCPIINGKLDWNFDYSKLEPFAEKYGLEWGGGWKKFKDMPHFQKTFGLTWQQLKYKHDNQDFIPGTDYIFILK